MPVSVLIDVDFDDDGYLIDDIGTTPSEFVRRIQADGGIWFPTREGVTPFIPFANVVMFYFDDGSNVPKQELDLTVN